MLTYLGAVHISSSMICRIAPDSEHTDMNLLGPRIKALREEQRLTQGELVTRCHLIGWDISRGILAKIEAQVRRITDDEVPLIAKALKVNIEELYS